MPTIDRSSINAGVFIEGGNCPVDLLIEKSEPKPNFAAVNDQLDRAREKLEQIPAALRTRRRAMTVSAQALEMAQDSAPHAGPRGRLRSRPRSRSPLRPKPRWSSGATPRPSTSISAGRGSARRRWEQAVSFWH
jgi:hypothetical protein